MLHRLGLSKTAFSVCGGHVFECSKRVRQGAIGSLQTVVCHGHEAGRRPLAYLGTLSWDSMEINVALPPIDAFL